MAVLRVANEHGDPAGGRRLDETAEARQTNDFFQGARLANLPDLEGGGFLELVIERRFRYGDDEPIGVAKKKGEVDGYELGVRFADQQFRAGLPIKHDERLRLFG